MSLAAAYLGAVLLGAATLPQFVRLLRTRSVDDLTWSFILLNFLGLSLLAARSAVIREWAFLAVNLLTATFWGSALAVKVHVESRPGTAPGSSSSRA